MRPEMVYSLFLIIIYILLLIWNMFKFRYIRLLGIFIFVVYMAYKAAKLYGRVYPEKKEQAIRVFLWGTLVFYLCFLFSLTFGVGRDAPNLIFGDAERLKDYLNNRFNLIPFRTILSIFKDDGSISSIMVNIVGNIAALMPLGCLFPALFKRARRVLPFLMMTSGVVIFIEITQFLFSVGACDIDDLILNVAGAFIVFLVVMPFRVPIRNRMLGYEN